MGTIAKLVSLLLVERCTLAGGQLGEQREAGLTAKSYSAAMMDVGDPCRVAVGSGGKVSEVGMMNCRNVRSGHGQN